MVMQRYDEIPETGYSNLALSALKWLSGIWEPFFYKFCRTKIAPDSGDLHISPVTDYLFQDDRLIIFLEKVSDFLVSASDTVNMAKHQEYPS